MTLHIDPAMLERTYELLRVTPPFRGWNLPEADDVVFIVSRSNSTTASHCVDERLAHHITVSQNAVSTLHTLAMAVAHEMVHMKEWLDGVPNKIKHGASFKRYAGRVCRAHNFDRKAF